jgi:hypothetical protein
VGVRCEHDECAKGDIKKREQTKERGQPAGYVEEDPEELDMLLVANPLSVWRRYQFLIPRR